MFGSADSYVTRENEAAEDKRLDFNRGFDAYGYGHLYDASWPQWYREGWQAALEADRLRCKQENEAEAAAMADMQADGLEIVGDDDASTDWDEYAEWYDNQYDINEDFTN